MQSASPHRFPWQIRACLGLTAAAYCFFWAYVLSRPNPPLYDEPWYLAQAVSLSAHDSFREWLLSPGNGPTGPQYALMHYMLGAGHGPLSVPWVRLPNLVLLAGIASLLAAHVKRHVAGDAWLVVPLVTLAVPMTWVIAGLALTEIPAMAGMTLAVWAAGRLASFAVGKRDRVLWTHAGLVALGFGMAVCGRQTYLLCLPGLLLIAGPRPRDMAFALAGLVVGLLPLLALISIWGGLVPPQIAEVGQGLKWEHGLMALCYSGVVVLFFAPGMVLARWRVVAPVALIAAGLHAIFPLLVLNPAASVQTMLGGGWWVTLAFHAIGHLLVASGAGFVVAAADHCIRAGDWRFAGHLCGMLALCAACVATTHQFSSRYVAMGLPFLIPLLTPWLRPAPWLLLRCAAGLCAGALILHSYFSVAP